jgi:hypothetical protein
MKRTWRVDKATIIDFNTGSFGRQTVLVNGEEFYRRRPWRGKALYEFVVPGSGTKAALEVRPAVVSGPAHAELRVGGRVMVEQSEIISCKGCGKLPNGYDAFCGNCGKALPKAESYTQRRACLDRTLIVGAGRHQSAIATIAAAYRLYRVHRIVDVMIGFLALRRRRGIEATIAEKTVGRAVAP